MSDHVGTTPIIADLKGRRVLVTGEFHCYTSCVPHIRIYAAMHPQTIVRVLVGGLHLSRCHGLRHCKSCEMLVKRSIACRRCLSFALCISCRWLGRYRQGNSPGFRQEWVQGSNSGTEERASRCCGKLSGRFCLASLTCRSHLSGQADENVFRHQVHCVHSRHLTRLVSI